MAPPRRRNSKRRSSRVVNARNAPASVSDPEPSPPPRQGFLASLLGPPRSARPSPVPAAPVPEGPPWTRTDYYVLSGLAAALVVLVGLVLGATSGGSTATVQSKPAPTNSQLTLASGTGPGFVPGETVTISSSSGASQHATVSSVLCDTITVTPPLTGDPKSFVSNTVTQQMAFPFTPQSSSVVAEVAAKPAPSRTSFAVTCNGSAFGSAGATVHVGSQSGVIKSVSGNTITLSSALGSAPVKGETVTFRAGPEPGGLLSAVAGLMTGELAIIILPVAAFVVRPLVVRLRRKPRPRAMEVIFFGAAIWVIDTFVLQIAFSVISPTTMGPYLLSILLGLASGFVLTPLIYPYLSRMLRPRPRPAPVASRKR